MPRQMLRAHALAHAFPCLRFPDSSENSSQKMTLLLLARGPAPCTLLGVERCRSHLAAETLAAACDAAAQTACS